MDVLLNSSSDRLETWTVKIRYQWNVGLYKQVLDKLCGRNTVFHPKCRLKVKGKIVFSLS